MTTVEAVERVTHPDRCIKRFFMIIRSRSPLRISFAGGGK
jgi:hypothetical protein